MLAFKFNQARDAFGTLLGRFHFSRAGNIPVAFALSLVPLLGMVGASIDYTNALQTRRQIQDAADAGVLAAAIQLSNSASVTVTNVNNAKQLMIAAITDNIKTINPDLPAPNITPDVVDGKVIATVTSYVPTSFLKLLNFPSIAVAATSKAKYTGDGTNNVEVALVMDATGSMADNNKLTGAKTAAKNLIDTLIPPANGGGGPSNDPNARIRLSVVPFSDYVNVGTQYAGASWLTTTANEVITYPGYCYNSYPNPVWGTPYFHSQTCSADGVPYDCSWTGGDLISYGPPVWQCNPAGGYQNVWVGCVGSRSYPFDMQEEITAANPEPAMRGYGCNNPLQRLDSRNATLSGQIAALNASGETYLAPGLLWGWRTLSPLGPFGDGRPYAVKTQKFIVLMTDGFNTRSVDYPKHDWSDAALSDKLTLETCTAIKAAGIKVFTVSFQVYNNLAEPLLKACASDNSYYYNAITNAALQGAFQNIADKISAGAAIKVHLVE